MPKRPRYTQTAITPRRAHDQAYGAFRRSDPTESRLARIRGSGRYRRVRELALRQHPYCVVCKREGKLVPTTEIDHIIPLRVRPDLAFSMENLQGLCGRHHALKSARERREMRP